MLPALPLGFPFSHHLVTEMKNQDLIPASCQASSGSPAMGKESLPALGPSSNPTYCPKHQRFTRRSSNRNSSTQEWEGIDGLQWHFSSALSSNCMRYSCLQSRVTLEGLWQGVHGQGKRIVQNNPPSFRLWGKDSPRMEVCLYPLHLFDIMEPTVQKLI